MILFAIVTFFYAGLILFLAFGFGKIGEREDISSNAETGFSIVVAFRNEAENLPELLRSFAAVKYPADKFEIILVNDASEDASEKICRAFMQENSHLKASLVPAQRKTPSPKKDAVNTAVALAQYDFILTTDADCVVPENWLQAFDSYISENRVKLIAGPVSIISAGAGKTDLLKIFQEIDFMSLQAATIGGFGVDKPFMCNGASLCYEKAAFLAVDGFEGNEAIASGEDVFFLEKIERAGYKTGFLKNTEALVVTTPEPDLRRLISQRIRWAAKTSAYEGRFAKFVAVVVFLMNVSLIFGLIAVLTGHFPQQTFLLMFLVKFNVDFYLIYKCAVLFRREKVMKNYFWCSFIYPFFSSYVAVVSLFAGYTWKGRRFKK